ncbi:MAG: hypothetical protein LBM76_01295, partial [Mycoplasmataceae bacterium]|nr:hypothetical protein [Mycoplasmataceae bacterium]
SNRIKLVTILSGALVVLAPTLTLTSCAKAHQYFLPIYVSGDGGTSTFADVLSDAHTPEMGYIDQQEMLTTGDGSGSCGEVITPNVAAQKYANNYIPVQTIYQNSGSAADAYGYYAPQDVTKIAAGDTTLDSIPEQHWKWRDYNDTQSNWVNTTDLNNIYSMQNINQVNLSGAITSAGISIGQTYELLWKYLAQDGILFNSSSASGRDDWFNTLNLSTDGADNDHLAQFYQFLFSLNNVLRNGKSAVYFDTSNSNFQFGSSTFGPGPLIDGISDYTGPNTDGSKYINAEGKYAQINSESNGVSDIASSGVNLLTSTNHADGTFSYGKITDGSWNSPYIAGAETATDSGIYKITSIHSVPVLIKPGQASYRFYDSIHQQTFIPDDWYVKSADTVKKQVVDSNAWKNINKLVPNWSASSASYSIGTKVTQSNTNSITSAAGTIQAAWPKFGQTYDIKDIVHSTKETTKTIPATIEYGIPSMYTNWSEGLGNDAAYNDIDANDFIGFASYSIYTPAYKDGDGKTQYDYAHQIPVFHGLSSIYPVLALFNVDKDTGNFSFDESLLGTDQTSDNKFPYSPNVTFDSNENALTATAYVDPYKVQIKFMKDFVSYFGKMIMPKTAPAAPKDNDECLSRLYFSYLLGDFSDNSPAGFNIDNRFENI